MKHFLLTFATFMGGGINFAVYLAYPGELQHAATCFVGVVLCILIGFLHNGLKS